MKNSFRRIAITFIVLSLLPVGFIIFELTSLNKNEKIVREIYQNQLDAILFSVNQYSDDVINSWANRINIELMRDDSQRDSVSLLSMLSQLNAVEHIYLTDFEQSHKIHSQLDREGEALRLEQSLADIIQANHSRMEKLLDYAKAGFVKMETLDTVIYEQYVPVFFVLDSLVKTHRVGVIVLNRSGFIENVLGPRMQSISQDKFVITVFDRRNKNVVYSTESAHPGVERISEGDETGNAEFQQKTLWLIPGYFLGISLKEATLDDLVNNRVMTSFVLLTLLIIVLIVGMVFLYRSIRKEMNLSQAKSEFVSNVSHEIRTPLSLISMYAETLEMNRVPDDKKPEYYSIIAKETTRLSRIVDRILNFSRMEANKKKYDFRRVQLNDICDRVLDSYFLHLQDQGFSINFSKDDDLQEIQGDRDSINEAIINLLDNAMKYSGDRKDIELRTRREKQFAVIEVQDRGIGIAKAHQHAIFEQFFRAPSGDVHNTKGSGLGLTLVKKTMEAHHGKVMVVSSPGEGSTFRLIFPIVENSMHT